MTQALVVTGNPAYGFAFYGPFHSTFTAIRWAESKNFSNYWWVADLIGESDGH